jgi:hypothetical protein
MNEMVKLRIPLKKNRIGLVGEIEDSFTRYLEKIGGEVLGCATSAHIEAYHFHADLLAPDSSGECGVPLQASGLRFWSTR